ncbi:MAG: BlaI/MecI/CopY family transcriptional regulator [Defluviitaleaceae bacterium]|nr:BlaI/MecI/CopY family transcriptional regulator [Defluviitaleaceae bacterium]
MKKPGRLSETETEVMRIIWELATPVTVSQLLSIFQESKGWKTSTLSTILSRLIEKGFLTKKMKGNVNYYDTNFSLHEYQRIEAQSLLTSLYGGNVKSFVAALVDDEGVTKEDIRDLQQWFKTMVGDTDE